MPRAKASRLPPQRPALSAVEKVAARFKGWRPARQELREVRAVPTIFPAVDWATGVGGWPIDRFGVVHGPSAHGKTSLALGLGLSFLQREHFFAFVDAEFSTPSDWLNAMFAAQMDNPAFVAIRPKSYESTVDAVRSLARGIESAKAKGELSRDTTALVVVDSFRKLVPEDFMAKIAKLGAEGAKGSIDGMSGRGATIKAKTNGDRSTKLDPAALPHRHRDAGDRQGVRVPGPERSLVQDGGREGDGVRRVDRREGHARVGAGRVRGGRRNRGGAARRGDPEVQGRRDGGSRNPRVLPHEQREDLPRGVRPRARRRGASGGSRGSRGRSEGGGWLSWRASSKDSKVMRWQGVGQAVRKLNDDPGLMQALEAAVRAAGTPTRTDPETGEVKEATR